MANWPGHPEKHNVKIASSKSKVAIFTVRTIALKATAQSSCDDL